MPKNCHDGVNVLECGMSKAIDKGIDKVIDEGVALAARAYEDVSPAVQEVGGFLGGVFGFFNHVVAAPLHRLNASFKFKTEVWIKNFKKRYHKIPEDNRQECPVNILGPTLESLKYNIDENELRDMFTNLLISSMDNRKSGCHPAFVSVINQMSDNDAIVLRFLVDKPFDKGGVEVTLRQIPDQDICVEKILNSKVIEFPQFVLETDWKNDIVQTSKCLSSLQRLGLIKIEHIYNNRDGSGIYEKVRQNKDLLDRFEKIKSITGEWIEMSFMDIQVAFTEFGTDFVKVCL